MRFLLLALVLAMVGCETAQKPRPVRPYISDGTIVPPYGTSTSYPDGYGGTVKGGNGR